MSSSYSTMAHILVFNINKFRNLQLAIPLRASERNSAEFTGLAIKKIKLKKVKSTCAALQVGNPYLQLNCSIIPLSLSVINLCYFKPEYFI